MPIIFLIWRIYGRVVCEDAGLGMGFGKVGKTAIRERRLGHINRKHYIIQYHKKSGFITLGVVTLAITLNPKCNSAKCNKLTLF